MLRSSVIVFPGSNCDRDVKTAIERVTGFTPNMVWHGDASVPSSDIIVLPGALLRNASLHFICRDVVLKVENDSSFFTKCYREGEFIKVPIAHGEGNYFADSDTLDRLEGDGRVAFRYCAADGKVSADANPNGAQRNIAGITSEDGRVLGMMPHPERLYEHALGGTDGRRVFESALLSTLEAA